MHIRLSHSALETFLTCERMFQLDRLLEGEQEKRDYPATVFGKAFGEGVSTYLLTQEPDLALAAAWKAYWPILEDDKRTEEILLNLLLVTFPKLDDLLMDWEVAFFQGKPAVELSFRIDDLGSQPDHAIYFVGYIDLVLKNRWSGRYAILENKTTGLALHDIDPLYKNSGQALGYSIVLDQIAGEEHSEYDVIYLVGQIGTRSETSKFSPTVHVKTYPKTLQDRLNWFISLGMDTGRLEQMLELGVFPLRGKNCLQYMRPCKHFGTCTLQTLDRYKETTAEDDQIEYQFRYSLPQLIESHIHRS